MFAQLDLRQKRPGGETGRRTGLKIPRLERVVTVRFRPRAPDRPVHHKSVGAASNLGASVPLARRRSWRCGTSGMLAPTSILQRLGNSLQAFAEHLVVHPHADAEVVGQTEKASGDD